MVAKRIVIILSCGILLASGAMFLLSDKIVDKFFKTREIQNSVQSKQQINAPQIELKYDLYSQTLYDLPLVSIMDISLLPKDVKIYIDDLLEKAQGFYYLKYNKNENKVFIILQNPISEKETYFRHGLEFVEIYLDNPKFPVYYSPGYEGVAGEMESAVIDDIKKGNNWKFDKSVEPYRPIKHILYNNKGKTQFVEYWSYSEQESQKYLMKDAKGKPISILKENFDGDSSYRKEHIFYNSDGNLMTSISINFDGANITRFTYFNSTSPSENCTIITEYRDGQKIKEKIYDDSYKLLNSYVLDYSNGVRKSLIMYDSENNSLRKISS